MNKSYNHLSLKNKFWIFSTKKAPSETQKKYLFTYSTLFFSL